MTLLVYKHGPEFVRLESGIPQVITDGKQLDIDIPYQWTFVDDIRDATHFDSERLAQRGRSRFCNLPWIVSREPTSHERNLL